MNDLKLLKINEACDLMGIGRTTLYELASRDQITLIKIGRATRIAEAELARFVTDAKRAA